MKWLIFGNRQVALRGQSLRVGRDKQCEVHLDESIASRKHASIVDEGGTYMVVDHTSRNGTFVNGRRVKGARELRHKDTIRVGQTEILFTEWTPTPGSMTNPEPPKDFSFSESTMSSASGDATQTGAKLICSVLYRSLRAEDLANAARIVSGLASRIRKLADSGALEAPELNAVAPAIIEYCRAARDHDCFIWLVETYAQRRLFPTLSIVASIRSVTDELGVKHVDPFAAWLERTRHALRTAEQKAVTQEWRAMLRALT